MVARHVTARANPRGRERATVRGAWTKRRRQAGRWSRGTCGASGVEASNDMGGRGARIEYGAVRPSGQMLYVKHYRVINQVVLVVQRSNSQDLNYNTIYKLQCICIQV
jgi:hypothetical protein